MRESTKLHPCVGRCWLHVHSSCGDLHTVDNPYAPAGTECVDAFNKWMKRGTEQVRVISILFCLIMILFFSYFTIMMYVPTTEVNARYPDAVDKHIRMTQFFHWSKDSQCMHCDTHTMWCVYVDYMTRVTCCVNHIRAAQERCRSMGLVLHCP